RVRAGHHCQTRAGKPAPHDGHDLMAQPLESDDVGQMTERADIEHLHLRGGWRRDEALDIDSVRYRQRAAGRGAFGERLRAIIFGHGPDRVVTRYTMALERLLAIVLSA